MPWIVAIVLCLLLVGCAGSTAPGPQAGSVKLPNCTVGVFGRYPTVTCNTGGMSLPVP
jgi:hypothetical protein